MSNGRTGEVTDPRAKAALAGGAAVSAGTVLAAGKLSSKKSKSLLARQRVQKLREIRRENLNKRQERIRNAHLSNQRNIAKGKSPKTLLQLAKSAGLKKIPAVGAFISLFASTPAGKGSDRGLPNPKD